MDVIEDFVGSVRRIGPVGPVYEVVGLAQSTAWATPMVHIRVIESGEELDYPVADVRNDPMED